MSVHLSGWAAVWSREDISSPREPLVVLSTNRCAQNPVEIAMNPDEARAVARALNRHANFLKPRTAKRRR